MPPPKKAAKKAAKKHAPHYEAHHHGKDLRRAYEHLGRVEILRRCQPSLTGGPLQTLAALAQRELAAGHLKDAADLLRGAEHLIFAALAEDAVKSPKPSPQLAEAIEEQFHELTARADEHWERAEAHAGELALIYGNCRESAARAYDNGRFHQALEFARAAESLAHAGKHGGHRLGTGKDRGDAHLSLTL